MFRGHTARRELEAHRRPGGAEALFGVWQTAVVQATAMAIGVSSVVYGAWRDVGQAERQLRQQEKKLANAMGLPHATGDRLALRRKLQRVYETRHPEARGLHEACLVDLDRMAAKLMGLCREEALEYALRPEEVEAWQGPEDAQA